MHVSFPLALSFPYTKHNKTDYLFSSTALRFLISLLLYQVVAVGLNSQELLSDYVLWKTLRFEFYYLYMPFYVMNKVIMNSSASERY